MANAKPMIAIESDPADPEDFAVTKEALDAGLAARRKRRGQQAAPVKMPVSIRLDADLLAALRAGGAGWQGRVNEALRKAFL